MLIQLTVGVNFINILRTNVLYERRFLRTSVTREKMPKRKRSYEKSKTLMKFRPARHYYKSEIHISCGSELLGTTHSSNILD